MTGPEPAWLSAWRRGPIDAAAALRAFDGLPGAGAEEMAGRWRGAGLPTGHPLDGLLEALGWHGKAVDGQGRVDPLLFRRPGGRVVALDPALMPVPVALAWPALARGRMARAAFAALGPVLRARGPAARIEARAFRGRHGAAILYDRQPIVDHLRRVDAGRVLGLMERRGMERPFFFLLAREEAAEPDPAGPD